MSEFLIDIISSLQEQKAYDIRHAKKDGLYTGDFEQLIENWYDTLFAYVYEHPPAEHVSGMIVFNSFGTSISDIEYDYSEKASDGGVSIIIRSLR